MNDDNTDEKGNGITEEVALANGEKVRVRTHLPETEMRYLADLLREQARLAAELGAAFTRIRSIDQEILEMITVGEPADLQKISPEDGARVTAAFTHGLGERGIGHLARIAMVGIREAKPAGGDR
jgi:hypothetical protein